MSTFVYAANEAEMTIKPEEDKTTNLVNIENIETDIGINQVPTVKIYGTTLVNLLGKNGNFETDSNGDGLADGWTNDAGLTAVVNAITTTTGQFLFGSKAQKVTLSADGEGGNYIEVTVAAAQALLVAGYIRAGDTSTTGKLIVDWRDIADAQISTDTVGTRAVASYARVSAALTAPANTVKARIYATVAGVSGKLAYFDGIQVHNLTAQGALDSIRAAKYSETNWSDLTEAQLEAEIPYFDSVMSVNVEDGTASELTVENRGKNLMGVDNFYNYLYAIAPNVRKIIEEGKEAVALNVGSLYHLQIIFDKFKPNTQYVLSFQKKTSNGSHGGRLGFVYSDGSNDEVTAIGDTWTKSTIISDAGKTISKLTFIGYFYNITSYFSDIQLEEGTSATDYVAPRTDSITIPDTCELHGFDGVFNYIDSNGNFIKNWERADKTTDGAGAFTLSGYTTGSKVICRNKTNGEVEVLDAAASVTTSWTEAEIEILYRLATAVESTVQLESTGFMLYPGDNNVLSPDSKTPVAIQVSDYTGVSSTSSTQAFIERFRATTKRGGRTFQPYGSRVLKSVPTSEEVAISLSKMNIDDETIGLALADGHFQIENSYTNANDGSTITDTYQHCRITSHGKEYSAGDIVKEDVEIECAKVVTS